MRILWIVNKLLFLHCQDISVICEKQIKVVRFDRNKQEMKTIKLVEQHGDRKPLFSQKTLGRTVGAGPEGARRRKLTVLFKTD